MERRASAICLAALLPLAWLLVRRLRRAQPCALHAAFAAALDVESGVAA